MDLRAAAADGLPALVCRDVNGNSITLEDLERWFGGEIGILRAQPHPNAPYVIRVTELHARDTGAVQLVNLRWADGKGVPNAAIARWFSSAPGLDPYPADCEATRPKNNAVIGWTNGEGLHGFGMGPGDKPPGWSGVWALHCDGPSDYVDGLGWSPGERHKVIEVTFTIYDKDDPGPGPGPDPDPDPGPGFDWQELGAAFDTMAAGLTRISAGLATASRGARDTGIGLANAGAVFHGEEIEG
jgi:hypothetical protein